MQETGNWMADNQTGRSKAHEMIETARETGDALPLARTIGEMIERGRNGPIEIGFVFAVVAAAI